MVFIYSHSLSITVCPWKSWYNLVGTLIRIFFSIFLLKFSCVWYLLLLIFWNQTEWERTWFFVMKCKEVYLSLGLKVLQNFYSQVICLHIPSQCFFVLSVYVHICILYSSGVFESSGDRNWTDQQITRTWELFDVWTSFGILWTEDRQHKRRAWKNVVAILESNFIVVCLLLCNCSFIDRLRYYFLFSYSCLFIFISKDNNLQFYFFCF